MQKKQLIPLSNSIKCVNPTVGGRTVLYIAYLITVKEFHLCHRSNQVIEPSSIPGSSDKLKTARRQWICESSADNKV